MDTYTPKPMDTSNVKLSQNLLRLVEYLAENAHENWAAQRIADGWTYGEVRDDAAKKHPDLVPYSDLTDAEKEYDRRTAMETLKVVAAMGYVIN